MKTIESNLEDIVTVGLRYGSKADILIPLFKKREPIALEDTVKILGFDEVILSPRNNPYDAHAVAVYSPSQDLLGYVWMLQAPSIKSWLTAHKKKCMHAKITKLCTTAGLIILKPEFTVPFLPDERNKLLVDKCWAEELPEVMIHDKEENLKLSFYLLCEQLKKDLSWSEYLQIKIDDLLKYLPVNLSADHYQKSLELFHLLNNSDDPKVVEQGELILAAFVHQGSAEHMEWWRKSWLPEFYSDVEKDKIALRYEAAGYTLDRVESILDKAPCGLYHIYKTNIERFPGTLYYASLPGDIYYRMLNLLAVRELMLKRHKVLDEIATDCCQEDLEVRDEELFHFIHPSISGEEELKIHNEVKRLVMRYGIQDICHYLEKMKNENKILLPQSYNVAYAELVRMGMPDTEGYNEKTFHKYYVA